MGDLQAILDKLNKLTFVEDKGNDTLLTEEGFTVSLFTKYQHSKFNSLKLPSIQVTLVVFYKGQQVKRWACGGAEDTAMVIDFFIEKQNLADRHETLKGDNDVAEGRDIFDALEFK